MARILLQLSLLLLLAYTSASCTKSSGGGSPENSRGSSESGGGGSYPTRPGGDATGFQGVVTIKVGGIYLHSPNLNPPTPNNFDKALLIDVDTTDGYQFTSAELRTFPTIGDEVSVAGKSNVAYSYSAGDFSTLVVDGETYIFNTDTYWPNHVFGINTPWQAGYRGTNVNDYGTFNPMSRGFGQVWEENPGNPFDPIRGSSIFFNESNTPLEFYTMWVGLPWQITMTPGGGTYSVLRFVAPCATNYRLSLIFREAGYFQSGVPVHFVLNGNSTFTGSVSHNSPAQYASPVMGLQSGDILEFIAGGLFQNPINEAVRIDLQIITQAKCP